MASTRICAWTAGGRLDHRSLTLELGTSPQASGSARLRLGSTDVMVAVRADAGTPPAGFPTHGRLSCAVELSASADPAYEGRGGGEGRRRAFPRARARLAGRFRGRRGCYPPPHPACAAPPSDHGAGAALAMESLGIQKGKSCWVLRCDCLVLSADGSALDALSVAIKAALADCKIPKVTAVAGPNHGDPTELELDDDPEQCARLDVSARAPRRDGDARRNAKRRRRDARRKRARRLRLGGGGGQEGNVRGVSTMSTTGKSVDVSSLRAMTKAARDVARRMHAATDAFLVAAVSRAEDEEDDEDDGA